MPSRSLRIPASSAESGPGGSAPLSQEMATSASDPALSNSENGERVSDHHARGTAVLSKVLSNRNTMTPLNSRATSKSSARLNQNFALQFAYDLDQITMPEKLI